MKLHRYPQRLQFAQSSTNLLIGGVCPKVSDIFKSATFFDDVIDGPGHSIGNGDLGLIGTPQFKTEPIILGLIEGVFLFDRTLSCLDQDFSKGWIAMSGFGSFFLRADS